MKAVKYKNKMQGGMPIHFPVCSKSKTAMTHYRVADPYLELADHEAALLVKTDPHNFELADLKEYKAWAKKHPEKAKLAKEAKSLAPPPAEEDEEEEEGEEAGEAAPEAGNGSDGAVTKQAEGAPSPSITEGDTVAKPVKGKKATKAKASPKAKAKGGSPAKKAKPAKGGEE